MVSRFKEFVRIAYLWLHYHLPPVWRFRDLLADWKRFCQSDPLTRQRIEALQDKPTQDKTILVLVMDPYWQMSRLEYLVAMGFILRGYRVKVVVADKLPAHASERVTAHAPPESSGLWLAKKMLSMAGVRFELLSSFFSKRSEASWRSLVESKSLDELRTWHQNNLPVGKLVKATLLNYFLANRLDWNDPRVVARFRISMVSALMALEAVQAIEQRLHPDKVILNNGGVLPHYVLLEYFRSHHIDTITWEQPPTVEGRTLYIGHNAISTKVTFDDWWGQHVHTPLLPQEQEFLDRHILKREKGTDTYRVFTDPIEQTDVFLNELGLKPSTKIVSLFTNLAYDSAVVDVDTIFSDMVEWILTTIQFFVEHPKPDVQLVIRIHPIEKILETSPARAPQQRVWDVIHHVYPVLPSNVSVIPSRSQLSSYTLMNLSSVGIVYNSSIAFELGMRGVPVVSCAAAAYNQKGFTIEPESKEAYLEVLSHALSIPRLSPLQQEWAKKALYAMTISIIRDPFLKTEFDARGKRQVRVLFERLGDLKPGRNRYLDLFFASILEKKPFRDITVEQILHDAF